MLAHAPFFMAISLIRSVVAATVGKKHRPGFQTRGQFSGESNVARLAEVQRQPYRQTIAIDHRMNFACQGAA
jgi:hypothetical protein